MSADPKRLQPPFRAMLRNKAKAVLTYYTPTPSPWRILGKIEGDHSAPACWKKTVSGARTPPLALSIS